MGCAGSKPSLLNHSANHANSPQKGFIIFNAKTIEYIKAHENELKLKIKEKCDQKLFANKTIKLKNKKLKLEEQQQQQQHENGDTASTSTAQDSLLNSTLANHEKEVATVDLAIDLVLKYVAEDFDIENFKSNTNHLSLKQIKKDILKKYNNIPLSALPLSSSSSANTTGSENGKTNTLSSTTKSQVVDSGFYKKALTTAIDEFGAVIQEQFILIADFKVLDETKKTVENQEAVDEESKIKVVESHERNDIPIIDDSEVDNSGEQTYTLKEALEQARHNFYGGKKSMVLMTKRGRYILRDAPIVADTSQTEDTTTTTTNVNDDDDNLLVTPIKPKTVTMFDTETRKTSKVAIAPEINIEDVDISATFKIIEASLDEEHVQKLMIESPAKIEEHDVINIVESTSPQKNNDNNDDGITTTTTTTITTTTTTVVDDNDEKTKVDVKKEIAISILNVGEVLAKTIDHYSMENEVNTETNQQQHVETILSPPPPPSPSIQVSTPASILSEDVEDKIESTVEQQQNEQNDSASFSSPSDLLSSLSSSSAMSSPQKNEEAASSIDNTVLYLMREMENQIGQQLDLYADCINNVADGQQQQQQEETLDQFVTTVFETAINGTDAGKQQLSDIDNVMLRNTFEVSKKVKTMVETGSEDDYEDEREIVVGNDGLLIPAKSNHIDLGKHELVDDFKNLTNIMQDFGTQDNDSLIKETVEDNVEGTRVVESNSEVDIKYMNVRKSISSISSNSTSNIPIRKILMKQKATIDDELNGNGNGDISNHNNNNNQSFADTTCDSFNDSNFTNCNSARNSLEPNSTPDIMSMNTSSNGKGGKKKFKSKLPIKK
jgi:hypothetical protein